MSVLSVFLAFNVRFVHFVRFCVRFVRYVRFVRVRLGFYRDTDKTDSVTPPIIGKNMLNLIIRQNNINLCNQIRYVGKTLSVSRRKCL